MRLKEELEARILDDPEDRAAWAVYGDWLAASGDPRGELVAIMLAIESSLDDRLLEREQQLLERYRHQWLRELAGVVGGAVSSSRPSLPARCRCAVNSPRWSSSPETNYSTDSPLRAVTKVMSRSR